MKWSPLPKKTLCHLIPLVFVFHVRTVIYSGHSYSLWHITVLCQEKYLLVVISVEFWQGCCLEFSTALLSKMNRFCHLIFVRRVASDVCFFTPGKGRRYSVISLWFVCTCSHWFLAQFSLWNLFFSPRDSKTSDLCKHSSETVLVWRSIYFTALWLDQVKLFSERTEEIDRSWPPPLPQIENQVLQNQKIFHSCLRAASWVIPKSNWLDRRLLLI